jgi:hypothetical protein
MNPLKKAGARAHPIRVVSGLVGGLKRRIRVGSPHVSIQCVLIEQDGTGETIDPSTIAATANPDSACARSAQARWEWARRRRTRPWR